MGWLDAVVLRHAVRVNGLSGLAVTRLDVLDGLPTLKIATAYQYRGETLTEFPDSAWAFRDATPVYETLPGWDEPIGQVRKLDDLPQNAQDYLRRVEEVVGVPVVLVSVGRERSHTIPLRDLFV